MSKRHAARPWLVVDNSSSSDSSTPCSRAKRIKGKCHLPGMPRRRSHMKTAFSVKFGNVPESAERPPNLSIIEATSVMDGDIGTTSSESQELFVALARNSRLFVVDIYRADRENSFMNDQLIKKQAWKSAATRRMLEMIADMGMDADQFAAAFHELIGCTNKKAAATALGRESLETYYISQFAKEFGIKLDYLLGADDDKENGYDHNGKYADKRKIAELEHRLA